MRLIRAVFSALKTFDRPATRRELERESGLSRDAVWAGLRGLIRRNVVVCEVMPRRRGTYRLVPGANPPTDLRGSFVRDAAYRDQMRRIYLGRNEVRAEGVPAIREQLTRRVASPASEPGPGTPRLVRKGVLDLPRATANTPTVPTCVLPVVWKGVALAKEAEAE